MVSGFGSASGLRFFTAFHSTFFPLRFSLQLCIAIRVENWHMFTLLLSMLLLLAPLPPHPLPRCAFSLWVAKSQEWREWRVETAGGSVETRDVIRLKLYGHKHLKHLSLCSCELTVNANEQCHKCAIKNWKVSRNFSIAMLIGCVCVCGD